MKRFFVGALVLFSLLSTNAFAQLSVSQILTKTKNSIRSKEFLEAKPVFRIKHFNDADTSIFHAHIFIRRDAHDSVFDSKYWIGVNEFPGSIAIHNAPEILKTNAKDKTATLYLTSQNEEWAVTSSMYGNFLWDCFLYPEDLLKDTAYVTAPVVKKMHKGKLCYVLSFTYPDKEEFKNRQRSIYITADGFIPVYECSSVSFQNNVQFSEFELGYYNFKPINESRFSIKNNGNGYKVDRYKERQIEVLDSGASAPLLVGVNLHNSERDTIGFKGNYTLLDFWYMGCMPCIKAIPEIQKLADKYSFLKVYGVNCFDTAKERIEQLPKFRASNNMRYPVLLTDKQTTRNFKVDVWPTIYLINKEGIVIYSEIGKPENFDRLESILKQLR